MDTAETYIARTTTHYTENSVPSTPSGVNLTTITRTWVSEDDAFFYNEEAVSITPSGGISIVSINGNTINAGLNTAYTLNENERWGGTTRAELTNGQIRVKCSAGSEAGSGAITVADATIAGGIAVADEDYPTGESGATAPSPFTINIVRNPLSLTTFPTITRVSEGVITSNVRTQISVTLEGTNNGNAEVGFEVLSGYPGTLYQNREGGSGAKKLLTYTDSTGVARVYLLPNSRTNQVRVWVSGRNPASTALTQAQVVTYTYGYADLTADTTIGGSGGSGQRGVAGTRLANPFVVKVIDGTRRGFPGAPVTFNITGVGSIVDVDDAAPATTEAALFPHPDFRAEPVDTQGNAAGGYDPLVITTDRNGEAKVYLRLSETSAASGTLHTVTAMYAGSTQTFTATGIEATSATYVLTVDTQRSAQTQNVALRTRASRPLVVRVLEGGVNPVTNQAVRFTTTDGTLSPRREAMQQPDRTGIPNRPHDRTILTNVRGEAWIDYIAGNAAGPVTIYARAYNVSDTDGSEEFTRIDSANTVTFQVNVGGSSTGNNDPINPYLTISVNPRSAVAGTRGTLTVYAYNSSNSPVLRIPVTLSATGNVLPLSVRSGEATPFIFPSSDTSFTATTSGYGSRTGTITVTQPTQDTRTPTLTLLPSVLTGSPAATVNLSVTVRGRTGNAVPGIGVQFALSGASGGAVLDPTVITSSIGVASARIVLPGTTGGTVSVRATLSDGTSLSESVSITVTGTTTTTPTTPEPEPVSLPSQLSIPGSSNLEGEINRRLANPLRIRIVDTNNEGVSAETVFFSITEGSGRLSPAHTRTDADGYAEVGFTPQSSGAIEIEVTSGTLDPVTFTITTGEPPDAITVVSGNNQSGRPGAALANPFVVEVIDENDDPVPDVTVTFAVTAGGGTLSETSVDTNNNGRAQTVLTLGDAPGDNTVAARVTGITGVTFKATSGAEVRFAASERPPMYWIDQTNGTLHRLVGAEVEDLASNIQGVTSLAVDSANGLIYFGVRTGGNSCLLYTSPSPRDS